MFETHSKAYRYSYKVLVIFFQFSGRVELQKSCLVEISYIIF